MKNYLLYLCMLMAIVACKKENNNRNDNSRGNNGTIQYIGSSSPTNNGILTIGISASGVSSVVYYTGGNGGAYSVQTITSTGVTGLTATLAAGTFNTGDGFLTFIISGIPESSGTASFDFNIGGQSYTLTRIVLPLGTIMELNCKSPAENVIITPSALVSGVNCIVPYTQGDGGAYRGQTINSMGVTGLTATLAAGNFNLGDGTLNFTISGTPSSSGTASFVLNIGGQNCTLQFNVNMGGLAIGTFYGGGVIGYIYQPGEQGYVAGETHGIIVALIDQSTGIGWGCYPSNIRGTSTDLGTGNSNTYTIVTTCSGSAAQLCYDLVLYGYSDWYMPSRDELQKLYNNRSAIASVATANGGTGFASTAYWSSSQNGAYYAWLFDFSLGSAYGDALKNYGACFVRAIRSF